MLSSCLIRLKERLLGPTPWEKDARMFRQTLSRWQSTPLRATGKGQKVGVLIMPWLSTRLPWFATAMGLLLARRGARVSFIVDDLMFGNTPREFNLEMNSINDILSLLETDCEILRLSDCRPGETAIVAGAGLSETRIAELAELNTIWFMRAT